MIQEKLKHKQIIDLGFTETACDDEVYYNKHGYPYVIIEKKTN